MKKEEKQEHVDVLTDELKDATGIYFLDFTGVNAQEFRKLRTLMRDQNIKIKVVKNIIAKMAMERLKFENPFDLLVGPTAISYSYENPIVPSKIMDDFSKEKEIIIKGGIIEGNLFSPEQIHQLAVIPSRDVLMQKLLLNLVNPLQRLRNVLCCPIQNFTGLINQISQKQS